jgi:hypothetical protein
MIDEMEQQRFDISRVSYRALSPKDLKEVKQLHKEWFPIDYPPEYFDRMSQPHIVSLGAFYVRED